MHPTIYTGIDNDLRLAVQEVDLDYPAVTTPLDTTGWLIEAYVTELPDGLSPVMSLSSSPGGKISEVDASQGTWDMRFSALDTAALDSGQMHLFVRGTEPGGEIRLIHEGPLTVKRGPTP